MLDEELIKSILKGNVEHYAYIIERHQTNLYRTAYHYTLHAEDARDVTQEIFIKAYNKLTDFRHGSTFSTWLYRIAINHCIDWTRQKKPPHQEMANWDIYDDEDSPEDLYFRQEMATEVQEVIGSLPEIYKTILILFYYEDLNPQEIAEILDIPKRTVETRLFRGRKILKQKLQVAMSGGEYHGLPSKTGQLAQLR